MQKVNVEETLSKMEKKTVERPIERFDYIAEGLSVPDLIERLQEYNSNEYFVNEYFVYEEYDEASNPRLWIFKKVLESDEEFRDRKDKERKLLEFQQERDRVLYEQLKKKFK
jgi:hypothetical protein